MKFIELNHTFSRLHKVTEDINNAINFISLISMLLFSAYYAYLIYLNIFNVIYLIIYSVLFFTIISSFIIEKCFKNSKLKTKKQERKNLESKRTLKKIVKVLKYLSKFILLGIATYEMSINFVFGLKSLLNIFLLFLLIFQIISEIIASYVTKEVDCFKLAFELDMNESLITKIVQPKKFINEKIEDFALSVKKINKRTPQEEKFINEIEKEKREFIVDQNENKKEKKEFEKQQRRHNIKIIVDGILKK